MSQKALKAKKHKLIMAVKLFLVEFRFYLFPLLTVFSFITNFSLVASSEGGDGGLEGKGGWFYPVSFRQIESKQMKSNWTV